MCSLVGIIIWISGISTRGFNNDQIWATFHHFSAQQWGLYYWGWDSWWSIQHHQGLELHRSGWGFSEWWRQTVDLQGKTTRVPVKNCTKELETAETSHPKSLAHESPLENKHLSILQLLALTGSFWWFFFAGEDRGGFDRGYICSRKRERQFMFYWGFPLQAWH